MAILYLLVITLGTFDVTYAGYYAITLVFVGLTITKIAFCICLMIS